MARQAKRGSQLPELYSTLWSPLSRQAIEASPALGPSPSNRPSTATFISSSPMLYHGAVRLARIPLVTGRDPLPSGVPSQPRLGSASPLSSSALHCGAPAMADSTSLLRVEAKLVWPRSEGIPVSTAARLKLKSAAVGAVSRPAEYVKTKVRFAVASRARIAASSASLTTVGDSSTASLIRDAVKCGDSRSDRRW